MKRTLLTLLISWIATGFMACENEDLPVPSFPKPEIPELPAEAIYDWEMNRTNILSSTDMVLLYGGGHHRSPYEWDKERLKAYVTYVDTDQKSHWLFDSFLFLEIMDKGEGGANKMFAKGYKLESANQTDWTNLIDYYFQSEKGIGALDRCIGEAKSSMGNPKKKHQIIISIPEPIMYQHPEQATSSSTYWGQINNKTLDFSIVADRIAACQWFIDRVRARFNEKRYENVELAGFYWLAEKATDTRNILNTVANYLSDLKYSFNWIPYYGADGYNQWDSFGFNYAYFQPNYFFSDQTPLSRLEDACSKALQYNMNMELEFDDDALESRGRAYKLRDYMQVFKDRGIWEKKRLAYYQGSNSLLVLKNSSNAADRQLYHDFCKFVITRPIRKEDKRISYFCFINHIIIY